MSDYRFQLVNVFADSTLSGNPLAVFEDARGLDTTTMQALALQFNLSETSFIFPSDTATAQVRIFTPEFEMPFAGHPTLGTAHVLRGLRSGSDAVTLQMHVGIVAVTAVGDHWTLQAAQAPRVTKPTATRTQIAAAIGLDADVIVADPLWIDTGSNQLVIPLRDAAAVNAVEIDAVLLRRDCHNGQRAMAYVFAKTGADTALVRFFFPQGAAFIEDPGTGSACANLGGYLVATQHTLPLSWTLSQGERTGRPCTLKLAVDVNKNIFVGGRVIVLGSGTISLP
jgi:trans-2,3-dihydro-3-hydroxyanthranilate isomerase